MRTSGASSSVASMPPAGARCWSTTVETAAASARSSRWDEHRAEWPARRLRVRRLFSARRRALVAGLAKCLDHRLDRHAVAVVLHEDLSVVHPHFHADDTLEVTKRAIHVGDAGPAGHAGDVQQSLTAAGHGRLYQLHDTGVVWQSTGTACSDSDCPGWHVIGNHREPRDIVAAGASVYLLDARGRVRRCTGAACSGHVCPPWEEIDVNPSIQQLVAAGSRLYKRHTDGSIFEYSGSGTRWTRLDGNSRTREIVAAGDQLYQRHDNGSIWRHTGSPCTSTGCLGWERLDNNPRAVQLAAGGGALYQRHDNGSIWQYSGRPCAGSVCSGWVQLDNNPSAREIVATSSALYQRHENGTVWLYTGPACTSWCSGWRMVGSDRRTSALLAGDDRLYQVQVPPF